MIKRLRSRLIAVNMITVTVMIILIFALIFGFTRESLRQESIRTMESIGQTPVDLFLPGDRPGEIHIPYFVIQMDKLGNILSVSGGYYELSETVLVDVLKQAVESGEQTGVLEEYRLRFLMVDNRMTVKYVFADISGEQSALTNLVTALLIVGVLAFGGFFGLSWWLASRMVRPVERAWEQQKQFLADASHELKTPLTVILTNGELLQNPECPEEDRMRYSGSVMKMAWHMRSLVERLLTLSRMDNNASNMVMEPVDLSGMVEENVLPFEPLYFERGLMLECRIAPEITVTGSREHLSQVVDILLDNAMKYSDSPGTVRLELRRQGRMAVLSLSNPGPGMEKQELEKIFHRFYRGDKARSRDGGFGLGLPIARSILQEHGGKIWAESGNGINTFLVSLPMA